MVQVNINSASDMGGDLLEISATINGTPYTFDVPGAVAALQSHAPATQLAFVVSLVQRQYPHLWLAAPKATALPVAGSMSI